MGKLASIFFYPVCVGSREGSLASSHGTKGSM
jgi:hypothetical protein